MGQKREDLHGTKADGDRDTASYAQPQGTDKRGAENQRQTRMPHERDESAKATGNRLEQDTPPSGQQVSDAVDDLKAGRQDTDRRGVPNDVPTSRPRGR